MAGGGDGAGGAGAAGTGTRDAASEQRQRARRGGGGPKADAAARASARAAVAVAAVAGELEAGWRPAGSGGSALLLTDESDDESFGAGGGGDGTSGAEAEVDALLNNVKGAGAGGAAETAVSGGMSPASGDRVGVAAAGAGGSKTMSAAAIARQMLARLSSQTGHATGGGREAAGVGGAGGGIRASVGGSRGRQLGLIAAARGAALAVVTLHGPSIAGGAVTLATSSVVPPLPGAVATSPPSGAAAEAAGGASEPGRNAESQPAAQGGQFNAKARRSGPPVAFLQGQVSVVPAAVAGALGRALADDVMSRHLSNGQPMRPDAQVGLISMSERSSDGEDAATSAAAALRALHAADRAWASPGAAAALLSETAELTPEQAAARRERVRRLFSPAGKAIMAVTRQRRQSSSGKGSEHNDVTALAEPDHSKEQSAAHGAAAALLGRSPSAKGGVDEGGSDRAGAGGGLWGGSRRGKAASAGRAAGSAGRARSRRSSGSKGGASGEGGVATRVRVYGTALHEADAATARLHEAERQLKRHLRHGRQARAMVHVLHASPSVHAFRWWYALRHSMLRLAVFSAILLGLASVSPFAWDYPTGDLLRHGKLCEAGLSASLVEVNSTADLVLWAGTTLLPGTGSIGSDGSFVGSEAATLDESASDSLDAARALRLGKAGSLAALLYTNVPPASNVGAPYFNPSFVPEGGPNATGLTEAGRAIAGGNEDAIGDAILRSGVSALLQDTPSAPPVQGAARRRPATTVFGLSVVGSAILVTKQRVLAWPAHSPRAGERVISKAECNTPEGLRYALQACLPQSPPRSWAWTLNATGNSSTRSPQAGDSLVWAAGADDEAVSDSPLGFLGSGYTWEWQSGTWPSLPQVVSSAAANSSAWFGPGWTVGIREPVAEPDAPSVQPQQWVVEERRLMRGNATEVATQMLAWLRGQQLPGQTGGLTSTPTPRGLGSLVEPGTTMVRIEATLYNATAGVFVGAKVETELYTSLGATAISLAQGTAVARPFAVALPLFTGRFPPSVAFEVVIGVVAGLLLASTCLRALRQCRTGQSGSPLEGSDRWRLDRLGGVGGTGGPGKLGGEEGGADGDTPGGRLDLRANHSTVGAQRGAAGRLTAQDEADREEQMQRQEDASSSTLGSRARELRTVCESHAYDVILTITLLWVLVDGMTLRGWMDGIHEAVAQTRHPSLPDSGSVVLPPLSELEPGSPSFGYVDLLSGFMPRWYRLLGGLAFAVLFGSVRIVSDVVIIPEVGPMLWAVFRTATHPTVLLYLLLLLATTCIFGVAFHTVIGYETAEFSTVSSSMLSLFQLSLGQVDTMRISGQALAIALFVFVAVIFLLTVNLFIAVTTSVLPGVRASSGVYWNAFITSMLEVRLASDAALMAARRADLSPLAEASALGIRAVMVPLRAVRPLWARAAAAVAVVAARVSRDAEAAVARAAAAAGMALSGHKLLLARLKDARRGVSRESDAAADGTEGGERGGSGGACKRCIAWWCCCCSCCSQRGGAGADGTPLAPAGSDSEGSGDGAIEAALEPHRAVTNAMDTPATKHLHYEDDTAAGGAQSSDSDAGEHAEARQPRHKRRQAGGEAPWRRRAAGAADRGGRHGGRRRSADTGGTPAMPSWAGPSPPWALPWAAGTALSPWRAAEFGVIRPHALQVALRAGSGAGAGGAAGSRPASGHVWLDASTAAVIAGAVAPGARVRADTAFAPVLTASTLRDASVIAGAGQQLVGGGGMAAAAHGDTEGQGQGQLASAGGLAPPQSRPHWLCEAMWLASCCCCLAVCGSPSTRRRLERGKAPASGCCLCCAWGPQVDRRRFARMRQEHRGHGRRGLRWCLQACLRRACFAMRGCASAGCVSVGLCRRAVCCGAASGSHTEEEARSSQAALSANWASRAAAAERPAFGADYRGVANDADDDGGYGSEDSEAMAELLVSSGRRPDDLDDDSHDMLNAASSAAADDTGAARRSAEVAGASAAREVLRWAGMSLVDVDAVAGLASAEYVTPRAVNLYGPRSSAD